MSDKMNAVESAGKLVLHGFAGLGVLYICQFAGCNKMVVAGIEIAPSQAEVIQTNPNYYTDNASGIRKRSR